MTAAASKTCTRCGVDKPLDDFSPHTTTSDGRASWCRPCAAAHNRERRRADPERRNRDRQINSARHRALEALRRRHPDEFTRLYQAELAAATTPTTDDDAAAR
jgi:hypothetical protein